jgi:alpha-galactosidase
VKFNTRYFRNYFLIVLFLVVCKAIGQTAIPIETSSNALVLNIDKQKDLSIIYYGKKLANTSEYLLAPQAYNQTEDYSKLFNSAYTPSGSRNLAEPAIAVTHADGNNSLDLKYVSHKINTISATVSQFEITLQDPVYPFKVILYYKVYAKEDLIEQWSVVSHTEKKSVTLHKFASANLHLKAKEYHLTHYHGDWAKEMQPEQTKLTHGIKVLDSKLGTRANLFQPSVFMVSLDQPASENNGAVLYGSMQWSGNFKIDFEVDPQDNLRILAGINNFASTYTLAPNEEFTTPKFMHLLSHNGKGDASRKMHSWARNYKILNGNGSRYTLLNNWEATYFDFDEPKLFKLIKDTKDLGVDMFLLDDGWFGNNHQRNDDHAGLGDWQENRKKLPNGIASLVKEATKNGVKFGIWIEPEMVNPKSDLYKQHPDWVVKQAERPEHYMRNQLVLDLSNPKVQDFVYNIVDDLFVKNPDLAYIKWDANSIIFNAHSQYLKNQSHFYIKYIQGLYDVFKRIRNKYPTTPIMLCSGGGGRVDYGALEYFTEFWPSDNTDPLERVFMQWEYSNFYPSITVANHITEWGHQPLKFKMDVAMMGKLGFDIVFNKLADKDKTFAKQAVENYNSFKDIIWQGDLYRLSDPKSENIASLVYVNTAKTTAIMFNYLVNNRYDIKSRQPIVLNGLDAKKKYKISEINLYPGTSSYINSQEIYSGEFLMTVGFNPKVEPSRKSVVLKIEEVL